MDKTEYLKNYKQYYYHKTRKIVTFPLLLDEHSLLLSRAEKCSLTANAMAKEVVLNFLENSPQTFQTQEQKAFLQEYMRISRGIATNINQIAHSSNMGEIIDINLLISSLKKYEAEFRSLVTKLNQ